MLIMRAQLRFARSGALQMSTERSGALRGSQNAPDPLRSAERFTRHEIISSKSALKVNKKYFWSDPKLFHD